MKILSNTEPELANNVAHKKASYRTLTSSLFFLDPW